jgi:hypothetical protein
VRRADVLAFRVAAQQLDRSAGGSIGDTAVLDLGVQDTGGDGATWALANRGVDVALDDPSLVLLWTLRGAPHVYRRSEVAAVAAATAPFSDADAGKRILNAAAPLKAAGIGNLEALDAVGAALRKVVPTPTVKGEASRLVTDALPPPYRRRCVPCDAVHLYELAFRLGALRGGLALEPGTSPPVLVPLPRFRRAATVPPHLDVIRGCLRLLGPLTQRHVAELLDGRLQDVRDRWPDDATEVEVEGERRWLLGEPPPGTVRVTRLLGPFDLFLQARDRDLLVADADHRKALWPTIGRPGAVLVDGEIVGTWRPRQTKGSLRVQLGLWQTVPRTRRREIDEQAERLAAHRSVVLAGVDG